MAEAADPDEETIENLKKSVHYSVGKICEQVSANFGGIPFNKMFIATLTEMTFRQIGSFGEDLEMFAKHAKRSTINLDDVRLLVRRSATLVSSIRNNRARYSMVENYTTGRAPLTGAFSEPLPDFSDHDGGTYCHGGDLLRPSHRRMPILGSVFIKAFAPAFEHHAGYIATVCLLLPPPNNVIGGKVARQALVCMQGCAVGYGPEDVGTPGEAWDAVMDALRQNWGVLPREIQIKISPRGIKPPWVDNKTIPVPADEAYAILEAMSGTEESRVEGIRMLTIALCAYAKAGSVSREFINKVSTDLRNDLGINLTITDAMVRAFWKLVSQWFDDAAAERFFTIWDAALTGSCLRLALIVRQAAWTNLTVFQQIIKAKGLFPDFPWNKLHKIVPGDFSNFALAMRTVGTNKYYGFKKDLGDARSTKYPTLGYCAVTLMKDVAGDKSLRKYQGLSQKVPWASDVDNLIKAYETAKRTREPTEADKVAAASFREVAAPDGLI